MKYLKALSIVALSAAFILTGCGKDTEEVQPVVEPIIQSQPAKEETTQEESVEEETTKEDVPPEEGMVRSPLTNEWISGDLRRRDRLPSCPRMIPVHCRIIIFPKPISFMNVR